MLGGISRHSVKEAGGMQDALRSAAINFPDAEIQAVDAQGPSKRFLQRSADNLEIYGWYGQEICLCTGPATVYLESKNRVPIGAVSSIVL